MTGTGQTTWQHDNRFTKNLLDIITKTRQNCMSKSKYKRKLLENIISDKITWQNDNRDRKLLLDNIIVDITGLSDMITETGQN